MTRIGLISDVHATPKPVEEALAIFSNAGVEHIVCAGDIAGYGNQLDETVALLIESGCQSIRGNHELMYLKSVEGDEETSVSKFFKQLPSFLDFTMVSKASGCTLPTRIRRKRVWVASSYWTSKVKCSRIKKQFGQIGLPHSIMTCWSSATPIRYLLNNSAIPW